MYNRERRPPSLATFRENVSILFQLLLFGFFYRDFIISCCYCSFTTIPFNKTCDNNNNNNNNNNYDDDDYYHYL